jgi:acyl-CoA reductase-like NAD-dependent aldehyde dehydrogenase
MLHVARRRIQQCYQSAKFSQRYFSATFDDTYGPFVNGAFEFPSSLKTFPVHSPATLDHLCHVKSADPEYVDYAVNIAQSTFESGVWSRADVRFRANVLNKIATRLRENIPRLARLEVAQTGRALRSTSSSNYFDLISHSEK